MTGRAYGAMPPPGAEWQIGRTAADIQFVNEAERYMKATSDPKVIEKLGAEIGAIKSGIKKLITWVTVENFLKD